ncbi:hypothetical protein HDU76_006198 [Blyttiomyces sp. JEL0837]|nr:hypothetical protein HDU76_006198 [Blyttiomyces sp. JEL0837]
MKLFRGSHSSRGVSTVEKRQLHDPIHNPASCDVAGDDARFHNEAWNYDRQTIPTSKPLTRIEKHEDTLTINKIQAASISATLLAQMGERHDDEWAGVVLYICTWVKVTDVLHDLVNSVRKNLALLEGKKPTISGQDTSIVMMGGDKIQVPVAEGSLIQLDVPVDIIYQRAREVKVGGCDFCKIATEQTAKRLKRCGRCRRDCYCSTSCQTAAWSAAWSAGHKNFCRKLGDFKVGDIIMLKEIKKNVTLNGTIMQIVGLAPENDNSVESETRWVVDYMGKSGKKLSVKRSNLQLVIGVEEREVLKEITDYVKMDGNLVKIDWDEVMAEDY